MTDFEWLVESHDPTTPPDFNQAMNRMLRKAKGKLVVFLQDFIEIPEYGLEAFWAEYNLNQNAVWTAPVGKRKKDSQAIEWDWRKFRDDEDTCNFMEWEIDWACAPLKVLKEVGGFDEELDKYWGFDNVNIGQRIADAGYEIRCLSINPAVAIDHNDFIPHPYQELRNPDFHNVRLQDIRMGNVTINYL